MRKLDISDYTVKSRQQDKETGEIKVVDAPYPVKATLIGILFHPSLQLEAREALERDRLANKINDCKDGFVLLEDAEYDKLVQAVNTVKGFSRNDVEFIKRVLEAETAKVAEIK